MKPAARPSPSAAGSKPVPTTAAAPPAALRTEQPATSSATLDVRLPDWVPAPLRASPELAIGGAAGAAALAVAVIAATRRRRAARPRKAAPPTWGSRFLSYVTGRGGINAGDPNWVEMERFLEVERRNQELRSFFVNFPEHVQRLNSTLELDEVIQIVVGASAEMLGASSVQLFLDEPGGDELKLVGELHRGAERKSVIGTRIPANVAPQAWILTQRTASRAQDWPFQHRAAGTLGIRTQRDTFLIDIAAPIHVGEERLGLLVASGLTGLTNHHQRILSCWANVSGLSIDNAKRMVLARQLADTDRMTRLLNHAAFQDRLSGEFNRVRRTGASLSLIMIDVDSFKRYNDSHGHTAGDRLLTRLAEILASHAPAGSLVARYGGEEFVVMLPDLDEAQAAEHAEALRAAVADPPPEDHWDPALGCVTVSAGVATFTPDLDNPQALVARADEALYVSKAEGRDRVTRASVVPAIERRQGDRRRQQQTIQPPRDERDERAARDEREGQVGAAKAGAFAWEIPSATLFRDA